MPVVLAPGSTVKPTLCGGWGFVRNTLYDSFESHKSAFVVNLVMHPGATLLSVSNYDRVNLSAALPAEVQIPLDQQFASTASACISPLPCHVIYITSSCLSVFVYTYFTHISSSTFKLCKCLH